MSKCIFFKYHFYISFKKTKTNKVRLIKEINHLNVTTWKKNIKLLKEKIKHLFFLFHYNWLFK
jgi:hypothetical protein